MDAGGIVLGGERCGKLPQYDQWSFWDVGQHPPFAAILIGYQSSLVDYMFMAT